MKRQLLLFSIIILLILNSTVFVYAQDITYNISDSGGAIIVTIYDNVHELEKSKNRQEIPTYALKDAGGTVLCTIKPALVRTLGGVELYFVFDSSFQLSAVRFRELIVESEWIGKNYFKVGSATADYTVKSLNFSLYTGRQLIYRNINIPDTEKRTVVRTKGLYVYKNNPGDWLSCQYQITGKWEIV